MDDRQANPGEDIIRSVGIQHYIHIQNAGVDCSFFSAAASGKTLPTYLSSLHHTPLNRATQHLRILIFSQEEP